MAPRRSIVWNYFERKDKDNVICGICNKTLKCVNNTSNMMLHLKNRHPAVLIGEGSRDCDVRAEVSNSNNEMGDATASETQPQTSTNNNISLQPASNSNNSSSSSIASTSNSSTTHQKRPRSRQLKLVTKNAEFTAHDKNVIDKALVKMIGKDLQPLSVVENEGFRDYTNALQPLYTLPTRKTLTNNLIPKFCKDISDKLKEMLDQTEHVGITTDIWSSDSNKSFITVTCHFIYNGEQKNVVLETKEIPGSHTGIAIANSLQEVFNKWSISEKITAIVTDNGANIKNAVSEQLNKTHVPCVAHTLNLCVTDAIDDNCIFKETLTKSKNIVTHFKTSNLAADKLRELQTLMNLPLLKVIQDVSTRWNSSLIMIERLLEIQEPLSAAMSCLPKSPEPLDASEWEVLSDCAKVLQPLLAMTEEMSGEKYPTLSMVIPLLRSIQYALKSTPTVTDAGLFLKTQLVEVISRRFSGWETNSVASKATFLDPRFMKTSFGLKENADKAEKIVIEEIEYRKKNQNLDREPLHMDVEEIIDKPLETEDHNLKRKELARKKLWEWVDSRLEEKKKSSTSSVVASTALIIRHYLELPLANRSQNPIPYCEKYKNVIPEIYYLQKRYLCLPATSVPSERLFSIAGQVANDRRSRLLPENVNNILFLNANMK